MLHLYLAETGLKFSSGHKVQDQFRTTPGSVGVAYRRLFDGALYYSGGALDINGQYRPYVGEISRGRQCMPVVHSVQALKA